MSSLAKTKFVKLLDGTEVEIRPVSRLEIHLAKDGNGEMMLRFGIVRPELDLEALSPLDYLLLSVAISVLSAEHELERQKVQGPDVGN